MASISADLVYLSTHDNLEDENIWVTVQTELFKSFTLKACSYAVITLTKGTIVSLQHINSNVENTNSTNYDFYIFEN